PTSRLSSTRGYYPGRKPPVTPCSSCSCWIKRSRRLMPLCPNARTGYGSRCGARCVCSGKRRPIKHGVHDLIDQDQVWNPGRRLPIGAEARPGGGVHFRVWAPRHPAVAVEFDDDAVEALLL